MSINTLSQSHNPKNQLSFIPFQPESSSPTQQIKLEEPIILENNLQNNDVKFYEQQIAKLVYTNTVIMAQLSSALEQKKIIMRLISQAQKRQENEDESDKEKRIRRCAKDIQRKHKCPQQGCEKSYGTQGSLFQHIRLKHPKINSHDPPLMLDPA